MSVKSSLFLQAWAQLIFPGERVSHYLSPRKLVSLLVLCIVRLPHIYLTAGWTTEGSEFDPGKVKNFLFSSLYRQALVIHGQEVFFFPAVSRSTVVSAPGSSQGVKLTDLLHLVWRSRLCGAMSSLPHTSSWYWRSISTGTNLLNINNF
jgi:hypothetical protein